MIKLWASVGSKCNSLKTNQVFKNEPGCPRAISYLIPPPVAKYGAMSTYKKPRIKAKRSNVHVQSVPLKWLTSV